MSRRLLIVLAALGSAALLAAAFAFQYLGGLAPCPLCLWQRWPHAAAMALGAVGAALPLPWVAGLGALAAATSGGIGIYHTGVERGWWEGPATCAAGSVEGLTPEELLQQIMEAPLVRCDEVAWSLAGLSMASWNALLSVALALLWAAAALRRAP